MTQNPQWLNLPEAHDYAAAADYLSLVVRASVANVAAEALKRQPLVQFKAKDILRASDLPHLATDNPHVARDLKKVHEGQLVSPILLVRGEANLGRPLIIADGYHRVCAMLHLDENCEVPCQIVDL